MDLQIRRDVEAPMIAVLAAGKMQKDAMPDLVRQDEEPFILLQLRVEIDIHEDIVAVGGGGTQPVVAHGNQFHAHDDSADEGPAHQEPMPILGELFQADPLAALLRLVGGSGENFSFHASPSLP